MAALSLALVVPLTAADADKTNEAPSPVPQQTEKTNPEQLWRKARLNFNGLFNNFNQANATMSPDGRYLSIVSYANTQTKIIIIDTLNKNTVVNTVPIGAEAEVITSQKQIDKELKSLSMSSADLRSSKDPRGPVRVIRGNLASIRWMNWVTPTKLIIETNWSVKYGRNGEARWESDPGTILSIDADSPKVNTLVTSDDVGEWDETITYNSYSNYPHSSYSNGGHWNSSGGHWNSSRYDSSFGSSNWPHYYNPNPFPANNSFWRAGRPTVFGLSHDTPETLIITSIHSRAITRYKLNYNTGKLRYYKTDDSSDGYMLADRTGNYRIEFPSSSSSNPPFTYGVLRGRVFLWSQKLDELSKKQTVKGFSASPNNYLGQRAIPVGFDADPNVLYYASNVGRNTHGIYAMNIKTGNPVDFKFEHPLYDIVPESTLRFSNTNTLVFDRYTGKLAGIRYNSYTHTTHWLDPEMQSAQDTLEKRFPGITITISEWSNDRTRFIVNMQGIIEPGGMYIYDSRNKSIQSIVRAAPWFDREKPHFHSSFSIRKNTGESISGVLIIPRAARLKRMPLVVYCPSSPWHRTPVGFSRELAAFAEMGFAVLQVNGRGTEGFGVKQLEMPGDVPFEKTKIDDIIAAIDFLAPAYAFDQERVALVGLSFGGYQSLRGLQLEPNRFRCAVAIQSPMNLGRFLDTDLYTRPSDFSRSGSPINSRETTIAGITNRLSRAYWGNREQLKEAPLMRHPEQITKPVLLLASPGQYGYDQTAPQYTDSRRMLSALKKHNPNAAFVELPKTREVQINMLTCLHIQDFLNAHMYDYQTQLGPMIEINEPKTVAK